MHKAAVHKKLLRGHEQIIDFLSDFVREYEFVPRGRYDPDWDAVSVGSLPDIASQTDLPDEIVWDLFQQGVIKYPLTYGDVEFLRWYRKSLEEHPCAKPSHTRSPRRVSLQALCEEWQCWVYLRYLKNRIDYDAFGHMLNPEKRIFVGSLVKEVVYLFGVAKTSGLSQEIRAIRGTASNDKRRLQDQGLSLVDIALQRGIGQETVLKYLET